MYRFPLGLIISTCVFFSPVTHAFDVSVEMVPLQYEVVKLAGEPEQKQIILGELSGVPEMFEVRSDDVFTLTVEIRAVPSDGVSPQFSGIIIRRKDTLGVEEVARMKAADALWTPVTDGVTGLTYQTGPFFSEKVTAGIYNIEVSTPNNAGKYLLVVGNTEVSAGYFDTLRSILTVYTFYGLGMLHMFYSPYVHYPVGIVVLLLLLGGTWYAQKRRRSYV